MRTRHLVISGAALLAAAFALAGCCGECGEGLSTVGKAAKGTYQFIQEMSTAPGTEELKQLGCHSPAVITPEMLQRLGKTLDEIEPEKEHNLPELPYRFVTCSMNTKPSFGCEEVASTYIKAVSDVPAEFGVTLQQQGKKEPICSGLYSAKGERLGELSPEAMDSMDSVKQQGQ